MKKEWTLHDANRGASGTTATAWTALNHGGYDGTDAIPAFAREVVSIQVINTGTGWLDYELFKSNTAAFTASVTAGSATLASGIASAYVDSPSTYAYYRVKGKMAAGSGTSYALNWFTR